MKIYFVNFWFLPFTVHWPHLLTNCVFYVFAAPTVFVVMAPHYVTEQEGSNIILPYYVTSDNSTTVTYSWMHENQYIIVDHRVYIIGGDLVINAVQFIDGGHYTCVVSTQVTDSLDAMPRVLHSNVSILFVSGMYVRM